MAMTPTSFLRFLSGRPVGKVPLPRPAKRASRISYKVGSDEKGKLPSGDDYLGMKLRKLAMVALAAGVLIACFRLGLLLVPVLLRDPFRCRSSASASSRGWRPRAVAARA
jgi:hypothetical protein